MSLSREFAPPVSTAPTDGVEKYREVVCAQQERIQAQQETIQAQQQTIETMERRLQQQ